MQPELDGDEPPVEVDEDEEEQPTSALHSTAEGIGLKVATIRQMASFKIIARDANGNARKTGGDQFFVFVRGNSKVRARVQDDEDGTYTVEYLPSCSGFYSISISLFGESLMNSPFALTVVSHGPDPSKCKVRGDALERAIARQNHTFEVLFVDALGGVAHAEELDVYVEPVLPQQPEEPPEKPVAAEKQNPEDEPQQKKEDRPQRPQPQLSQRSSQVSSRPGGGSTNRTSGASTNRSGWSTNRSTKQPSREKKRVEVQGRPLIVRAAAELDSPQVGMLFPGQLVNVLEERKTADGVRARVSVVEPDAGTRAIAKHWRSLHATPFEAVEEELMSSPRDNLSAAQLMGLPLGSTRRGPGFDGYQFDGNASMASAAWMMATPKSTSRFSTLTSSRSYLHQARSFSPSRIAELSGLNATAVLTDFDAPAAPRRRTYSRLVGEVGWVTLEKGTTLDKKLVMRRSRLDVSQRQQHLQQWQRRLRADRAQAREASKKEGEASPSKYSRGSKFGKLKLPSNEGRAKELELDSDPEGVGFAYGGIEPGILKARGHLHSVHRVHYSIGKVGTYYLHVGLRKRAVPLPGSPFTLQVSPGPAYAPATRLPDVPLPLKGVVGVTAGDAGCSMVVSSSDRMGNRCSSGGASIKAWCTSDEVNCKSTDMQDGTYSLQWTSTKSGHFDVSITIDGMHVRGSPTSIQLSSTVPDLLKTELSGPGLTRAVAGRPAIVRLKFVDEFGNSAKVSGELQFQMALIPEKTGEKLANVTPYSKWESKWIREQDEELYEVRYEAELAGNMELHLWCNEGGVRKALPGSPYLFTVRSGKPVAEASFVDGWAKDRAESSSSKKNKAKAKNDKGDTGEIDQHLFAGDAVVIKPQLRDAFGNLASLPDGALTVEHLPPTGKQVALEYFSSTKNGLVSYDVRLAPKIAGQHKVFILLHGSPVKGSPVDFEVSPATHDVQRCVVLPPTEEAMYIETKYEATLCTYDQYGNASDRGGAMVSARLQYVKQGIHDATILNSMNHAVAVEDLSNGKYTVSVHLFKISSVRFMDVNLLVNMDRDPKERPNGIDLAPLTLRFWKRDDEDSAPATSPDKSKLGRRGGIDATSSAALLRRGSSKEIPPKATTAELSEQPLDANASMQSNSSATDKPSKLSDQPLDANASMQSISSVQTDSSAKSDEKRSPSKARRRSSTFGQHIEEAAKAAKSVRIEAASAPATAAPAATAPAAAAPATAPAAAAPAPASVDAAAAAAAAEAAAAAAAAAEAEAKAAAEAKAKAEAEAKSKAEAEAKAKAEAEARAKAEAKVKAAKAAAAAPAASATAPPAVPKQAWSASAPTEVDVTRTPSRSASSRYMTAGVVHHS